jgi:hypothetical protein
MVETARHVVERYQHVAEIDPEVDRGLQGRPGLRQVPERDQRLLESRGRLPVGRAPGGLETGLPEVAHGLVPGLGADRMMTEPLDVLGQPVGVA